MIRSEVINAIYDYQRAYFPDFERLARAFLEEGRCSLSGNTLLDWPFTQPGLPELRSDSTWQYSWHSLHPAVYLMLLADKTKDAAPIMAARDFVTDWLVRSYEFPHVDT